MNLTPILSANILLSVPEVAGLERVMSYLNASVSTGLTAHHRSRVLTEASTLFHDSPKPAAATLPQIGERTRGYLFRFPGDPDQFARLVAPQDRAPSSTFRLTIDTDFPVPLLIAGYAFSPELDHIFVRRFLRLSALFQRINPPDAYGEIQDLAPNSPGHQLLQTLLGMAGVFPAEAPRESSPPASGKRGPKSKKAAETV